MVTAEKEETKKSRGCSHGVTTIGIHCISSKTGKAYGRHKRSNMFVFLKTEVLMLGWSLFPQNLEIIVRGKRDNLIPKVRSFHGT